METTSESAPLFEQRNVVNPAASSSIEEAPDRIDLEASEEMASDERAAEEGGAGASHKDEKNMALYTTLGVGKKATDDEIKKAYRKLALRYHPDKNIDGDPEKTEKFKEINYANSILSNPNKRRVYDEMGDAGLKLMEQFGEDEKLLQLFLRPWFKWVFLAIGILSCGFCFCCCFCCCCYFCCGKCKPKHPEEENEFDPAAGTSDENSRGDSPIVAQPGATESDRPTVIAMGPPPSSHTVIAMPPPDDPTVTVGDSQEKREKESSPSHPAQYGSVDLN